MTPDSFIARWRDNLLNERAGAQSFFLDLCDLLGVDKPNDPENYCFERGATRTGAGRGWADVWKRGYFAWENKAPGGDLAAALKQLMSYALALDNPPLLVVCDRHLIQIHTHFTGTPSEIHPIPLEQIGLPENAAKLGGLFSNPEMFRPRRTDRDITLEAAGRFADVATALAQRGHDPRQVAHFLIQCLFCMFAEDVGLLPERLFERIVDKSAGQPDKLSARLAELFASMRGGGEFLLEDIAWFNGGLFETAVPMALTANEAAALLAAAKLDWSPVEPSIFGTLFERGLNPALRSQLGANFTDPDTIRKIIDPVIVEPLAAEWAAAKTAIAAWMQDYHTGGKGAKKAQRAADQCFLGFLERLKNFRVLDPACGSGNFLYLALRALKDLEHRANLDAEALGLHRQLSIETCPRNVLGIEINPYAAELARVTVWIGEIQWMLKHGYDIRRHPILAPLDHIECRDAVLNTDHGEPDWPTVDVIIGNPPFLGGSKLRRELGDDYAGRLRPLYAGRIPGGADLVTYWFEKARRQLETGMARRAGLVATNSIRGGANRKVLERIVESAGIFAAWSDEPWINDGAAVRVSLVCFGTGISPNPPFPKGGASVDNLPLKKQGVSIDICVHPLPPTPSRVGEGEFLTGCFIAAPSPLAGEGWGGGIERLPIDDPPLKMRGANVVSGGILNGQPVAAIYADLTGRPLEATGNGLDLTHAQPLPENAGVSFQGSQKIGAFDIPGDLARQWLQLPNPHGHPNSDVLKPSWNGLDVTRRPRDGWIIDFGAAMTESEAMLYEAPFEYAVKHVKPEREQNNREAYRRYWWRHGEPRIAMRAALKPLARYIATPEVAKHRIFVWLPTAVLPDKRLIVFAADSDYFFGVLHSRFHELWSLKLGATLEDRPCYRPTTCFETFPFPDGLQPNQNALSPTPLPQAGEGLHIAAAAQHLNALRENWLNPPEWVERIPEISPLPQAGEGSGVRVYPDRIIPKPAFAAELKKRTLTHLYNVRPTWLDHAHRTLDNTVAAAYGWSDYAPDWPDAAILQRLLALNLDRAGARR